MLQVCSANTGPRPKPHCASAPDTVHPLQEIWRWYIFSFFTLLLIIFSFSSSFLLPPELQPYKYAGYPMLITTIQRETTDSDLFSKSAPILTAASEVAFHTMNTSALNAEELRRENGIQVGVTLPVLGWVWHFLSQGGHGRWYHVLCCCRCCRLRLQGV